jgi:predicted nucleic acid-binding protein
MPVADTLLRLAEPPALYQARWTDQILAEVTRTLIGRFGKTPEKAEYREAAMREFFGNSMVANFEALIAEMTNHPKDRHVLAAAVACRADYLVSFNLKDFPRSAVERYRIVALGPSAFLKRLLDLDRAEIEKRVSSQAEAIGVSVDYLLHRLAVAVPGFVSSFRHR